MNKQCIVFVLLSSTFFFILESLSADPSVIGTKTEDKVFENGPFNSPLRKVVIKNNNKKNGAFCYCKFFRQ